MSTIVWVAAYAFQISVCVCVNQKGFVINAALTSSWFNLRYSVKLDLFSSLLHDVIVVLAYAHGSTWLHGHISCSAGLKMHQNTAQV